MNLNLRDCLSQDYAEAARLRDMVKSLQGEDPVVRLKTLMEKAIAEERYAVSSKLLIILNLCQEL